MEYVGDHCGNIRGTTSCRSQQVWSTLLEIRSNRWQLSTAAAAWPCNMSRCFTKSFFSWQRLLSIPSLKIGQLNPQLGHVPKWTQKNSTLSRYAHDMFLVTHSSQNITALKRPAVLNELVHHVLLVDAQSGTCEAARRWSDPSQKSHKIPGIPSRLAPLSDPTWWSRTWDFGSSLGLSAPFHGRPPMVTAWSRWSRRVGKCDPKKKEVRNGKLLDVDICHLQHRIQPDGTNLQERQQLWITKTK